MKRMTNWDFKTTALALMVYCCVGVISAQVTMESITNNKNNNSQLLPEDRHKIQLIGHTARGARSNQDRFRTDLQLGLRDAIVDAMTMAEAERYGQRRQIVTNKNSDDETLSSMQTMQQKTVKVEILNITYALDSTRFMVVFSVLLDGEYVDAEYIVRDLRDQLSIDMFNRYLGVAIESYSAYVTPEQRESSRYWIVLVALGGMLTVILIGWFCLCAYYNVCGVDTVHVSEERGAPLKRQQFEEDKPERPKSLIDKGKTTVVEIQKKVVKDNDVQTDMTAASGLDDLRLIANNQLEHNDTALLQAAYASILKAAQQGTQQPMTTAALVQLDKLQQSATLEHADGTKGSRERPSDIGVAQDGGHPGESDKKAGMTLETSASKHPAPSTADHSQLSEYRESVNELIEPAAYRPHKLADQVEHLFHIKQSIEQTSSAQPRPQAPNPDNSGEIALHNRDLWTSTNQLVDDRSLHKLYVESLMHIVPGNAQTVAS